MEFDVVIRLNVSIDDPDDIDEDTEMPGTDEVKQAVQDMLDDTEIEILMNDGDDEFVGTISTSSVNVVGL